MVRARIARLKGQTRRLAEPQPFPDPNGHGWQWHSKALLAAGYGAPYIHAELGEAFYRAMEEASKFKVGDRIWWREAFRLDASLDRMNATQVAAKALDAGHSSPWAPIQYEADGARDNWVCRFSGVDTAPGRYRHARFMPRWACRLVDEISEVRVQRLQQISEEDAIAEGIEPSSIPGRYRIYGRDTDGADADAPVQSYRSLWEFIHGPGSWDPNPFVVALTFKETTP